METRVFIADLKVAMLQIVQVGVSETVATDSVLRLEEETSLLHRLPPRSLNI